MGFEDVLTEAFGSASPEAYEKAVRFVSGMVYSGIVTMDEAALIIKKIDEIEDMEG